MPKPGHFTSAATAPGQSGRFEMKTICLWSGPRNVSTALMYSFAERPDTLVVDEPLYGHYLRVSGADHPGRDEITRTMNCDGDAVMQGLLGNDRPDSPIVFIKHMAHHLVDMDLSFLATTRNVFLVRDPQQMLPSLTVQIPHARLADTGLKRQWEVYRDLVENKQSPVVIDAKELLLDPPGVIATLCQKLGLDYCADTLKWSAGPIDQDGIWAKHWYHAVHKSTGFQEYSEKTGFPDRLRPLLDECRPYYEKLHDHAIKARPAGDSEL